MVVNNKGLEMVGSFIRGLSPTPPSYVTFDTGSSNPLKNIYYMDDEVYRSVITWSPINVYDSNGVVIVSAATMAGSNINALGIGTAATSGSDIVAREITTLGEKTIFQSWIISFEWKNRSF
jgi:hypothetical protein